MSATWPPGLPRTLDYPEVPVPALLAGSARRYGDRVAFEHGDRELGFAELWERACRFANGLLARAVHPGDRVALRMPNCLEFPVAYYGTLLAGATFVPVNPLLPEDAARAQLRDADARLTVGADDVPVLCGTGRDTPQDVEIDSHGDLAHLAYTGGTTGLSKGVRLTHRNVVVNALQFACWQNCSLPALDPGGGLVIDQIGDPGEFPRRVGTGVVINLTPWFHAMGIGGLNTAVLAGTRVILHDRFDPAAYLADAERNAVTAIAGAPALFAGLLGCPDFHTRDLSSVLAVVSGAAPMPQVMAEALARRLPNAIIAEGYGLTEATMGVTSAPPHRSATRRIGTVGVPVFDTEVRIADPADSREDLPAGEHGEVCVRGPQVMAGYHNRPEATADVLADGWLRTGDIGVLDPDGFLSIVDRKKDMLLYKGYNVYPRELEELLLAHPGVVMAAVVGRPDPQVGELPVAFVVRRGPHVAADDLMAHVNDRVVPCKRLREVVFVDSIPVSAAGKTLKRELRARFG